ncbi:MAG: hypothetical protein PHS60_01470 [Zavarzinia sp.]|nr:hypothetical protein [Zavarzinia sp.]
MRKFVTALLVLGALGGLSACGKRGDPMRPGSGETVNLPETAQPNQTGTYDSGSSGTTPQTMF